MLAAETNFALQVVGSNLSFAVEEPGVRATTPGDELDRQIPDTATPVTVASRARTLRRVVFMPAAPSELTTELLADLALGARVKGMSDAYPERFCETSLDGLGPGVPPQTLNKGASAACIGQFLSAVGPWGGSLLYPQD